MHYACSVHYCLCVQHSQKCRSGIHTQIETPLAVKDKIKHKMLGVMKKKFAVVSFCFSIKRFIATNWSWKFTKTVPPAQRSLATSQTLGWLEEHLPIRPFLSTFFRLSVSTWSSFISFLTSSLFPCFASVHSLTSNPFPLPSLSILFPSTPVMLFLSFWARSVPTPWYWNKRNT